MDRHMRRYFCLLLLPLAAVFVQVQRPRPRCTIALHAASEDVTAEVVRIIQQECPSFDGTVTRTMALSTLESECDSLDTLEAMMELEEHFKVELEDEWMEEVQTVQDLADLIWRTPRGLKLRTVSDETYIEMIRKSHAENRWGELYEGWEKDIPSQYEHQGPSLEEEHAQQASASSSEPTSPAPTSTPEDLRENTVAQLRAKLRWIGLDDTGTKAELRERLAQAMASSQESLG
ncbi:Acyl carrier protein 4, chloroplastic [Symbiodinium microadriaticum]|uniref:Acyl carrier protein 4, chloroplastic n=1 Tax=Symbiodinium microadriaticum TaxID=2951 RepID=A0A1Q9F150_SYMMI|nr:Acyl carrier protein 4, chloroplastic [Symbiodinium microadriaticum]